MTESPAPDRPQNARNGPSPHANQPPQTPPTPARENRVHFCQGGLATGGGVPPLGAMLPVFLPHILAVLVAGFLVIADPLWPSWVPREARVAAASLAVLALIAIALRAFWLAYKRATDIAGLPMALDERARVNVSCWNDQRKALEALEDTAFEPEQFRTFLPGTTSNPSAQWHRRRQNAISVVLPALISLPIVFTTISGNGLPVLVAWSIAIVFVAWRYRKPTYLRVFPGRLEVRRYPNFGLGTPSVETIDLRHPPVRLDLKLNALHVGEWTADSLPKVAAGGKIYDPQPEDTRTVRLWPIFGQRRAIELIYRAIISTAEAPAHELD